MTTRGRENVASALTFLLEADRQSGGFETDAEALVQDAVKLLVDKLNRMPPDEAALYSAADIEAAIKELVGLKDRAPAAGHQCSVPEAAPGDPGDTEPDDQVNGQAARCAVCGTTEGQIIQRTLYDDGGYDYACDWCGMPREEE